MGKQASRFEILKHEGWTRQFIANEARLIEAVELYKQSGFDVRLESGSAADEIDRCPQGEAGECLVCFEGNEDQYKIIYTRQKDEVADLKDDLFDAGM